MRALLLLFVAGLNAQVTGNYFKKVWVANEQGDYCAMRKTFLKQKDTVKPYDFPIVFPKFDAAISKAQTDRVESFPCDGKRVLVKDDAAAMYPGILWRQKLTKKGIDIK